MNDTQRVFGVAGLASNPDALAATIRGVAEREGITDWDVINRALTISEFFHAIIHNGKIICVKSLSDEGEERYTEIHLLQVSRRDDDDLGPSKEVSK